MTDRQITHGPGCWDWGPRHYECALEEIKLMTAEWERVFAAKAAAEARAERLAEALCGLKGLMLGQVKWEPCDCGCSQQRTPDGPHSATWLRAVQQVEIAISKAEGKE